MILHSYYRSSAAYRVRIALNLKGISYTQSAVNLLASQQHSPGYLARNPQGLVPALELDDGSVIAQSTAILEWLEECYPEPALLPAGSLARARVRSLCSHIACDVHPLNNMSVTSYLKEDLGADDAAIHRWYTRWMHRGFSAFELMVRDGNGRYCHGDVPGLADCLLIPQMFNAFRFDVDMGPFPTLCSIYAHCNTLEAFAQAQPTRQPDAPPV
ncbi:maleylacetoacetate isomerase [Halieaceae bacterium]|nr:maleylacetoacetate isomerase [Halieaceae bacterium]